MQPSRPTTAGNLSPTILRVAVPCPLHGLFDYLMPPGANACAPRPGMRVQVPFGKRELTGIIVEVRSDSPVAAKKLRPARLLPDTLPVFPADILRLLRWAARYYLHPPGEALQTALPVYLRDCEHALAMPEGEKRWRLKADAALPDSLQRKAPRQYALAQYLRQAGEAVSRDALKAHMPNWRTAMKALRDKGLVEAVAASPLVEPPAGAPPEIRLNPAQQAIVEAILAAHRHGDTRPHCLFGVTGSGKTEVYLALARAMLQAGKQVLLLAPEISLTPQLTRRFSAQLGEAVAVLHSGLNDSERFAAWLAAARGQARVVIGTRSSVFTPMPALGLIIVDEEHDASYKQQDGLRYHARDLAVVRARDAACPLVLGSATPSLETLHNCALGDSTVNNNNNNEQRYVAHYLHERAQQQAMPSVRLLNICNQPLEEGLAANLVTQIDRHLQAGGQVLLFINRRGFAPLLLCHQCGWTTRCGQCDANMTYHHARRSLHCHHCDAHRPAPVRCEACGSEALIALGSGTERIEQFLQQRFASTPVVRIDRDSTRRKGALHEKLQRAHSGEAGILVGTQMLAKGHDFPGVTLVGILDTDQALYSSDFRATEHLAQLITQVAGRAGRGQRPGEVLIQTHHPEHPLLQSLLREGYEAFARKALEERRQTGLPPARPLVLLRCEHRQAGRARAFLEQVRERLQAAGNAGKDGIELYGPMPASMERRAGRYRYQLMAQAQNRQTLHAVLRAALPEIARLKAARALRWSIDVDPVDTF